MILQLLNSSDQFVFKTGVKSEDTKTERVRTITVRYSSRYFSYKWKRLLYDFILKSTSRYTFPFLEENICTLDYLNSNCTKIVIFLRESIQTAKHSNILI